MVQQPRIHSSDVQTSDHVPDHAALCGKICAGYQIAEANRSAAAPSIRSDAGSAFLLWMGSLKWTSVASSTIILALQPVFVMMGAYFWFKEKTSLAAIGGMAIAFLGVFLLIGSSGLSGSKGHLTGDIMSLLGTAAVAVHMLLGQLLLRRLPSFLYSWLVFAVAASVLAVYNVGMNIPMTGYSGREWGIFALLAVVPTVFGHLLFNWLMKYATASTVSMSVLGEPVGASVLAFLLLNESMNSLQAAGERLCC